MVMSEVSKLFAVLAAAYSRFDVDDIKLQLWYEMYKGASLIRYQILGGGCLFEEKYNQFGTIVVEKSKMHGGINSSRCFCLEGIGDLVWNI